MISIHSLVKRETCTKNLWHCRPMNFNPLPRKEGDAGTVMYGVLGAISIHSLVKRETIN